ncbi:MAG: 30S ribosomal protein S4 [bacterium]|nr:30S ribosomal protein S4 [bacterium]
MENKQCRTCRRLGVKLFLKGGRCASPKCAIIKRPYSPGQKGKRPVRGLSEYGKELAEKQRLKNWYNLRERQFSGYVLKVLGKTAAGDAGVLFIKELETRLDNVVFRLGFADSRKQSRQLVNHGHFLVNGKKIDIPSYQVKKGDVVVVRPQSKERIYFKNIKQVLKKDQAPAWLKFDPEKMEAQIMGFPTIEEAAPPAELASIFEFYSK